MKNELALTKTLLLFGLILIGFFLFGGDTYAYSVQRGTATLPEFTGTLNITLDTPVAVGSSVPIVTCNGTFTSPSRMFCRASLNTVVDGNYTELEVYRYSTNLGSMDVSWQVIENDDFTVQTGTSTFDATSPDIAISAVDLSKAFIIVSAANNSGHSYNAPIKTKFNSTTEINLSKGNYGSGIYTYARWYVVEWEGATVQSGEVTLSAATSTSDTISEVDLDNSFLLHSFTTDQTNYPARVFPLGQFASNTSVEFVRGATTGTNEINYFVVTHPDITTQRGTVEIASPDASGTASITPVTLSSAFLVTPPYGNGRHTIDSYNYVNSFLNTHTLTDTSTVTIERGATEGTLTAYWQVVSLAAASASNSSGGFPVTPTCQISASPKVIKRGLFSLLTLTPNYQGGKTAFFTQLQNDLSLRDSQQRIIKVTPQETTDYTLAIVNARGANYCSTTVTVEEVAEEEVHESPIESEKEMENLEEDEVQNDLDVEEESLEEEPTEEIKICDPYINSYIHIARQNNKEDVTKLEQFLNNHEGETLPINGVYEKHDRKAVIRFQEKYAGDILSPWDELFTGTGYVYKTTMSKINELTRGWCS